MAQQKSEYSFLLLYKRLERDSKFQWPRNVNGNWDDIAIVYLNPDKVEEAETINKEVKVSRLSVTGLSNYTQSTK